jgi:hypothetical protein
MDFPHPIQSILQAVRSRDDRSRTHQCTTAKFEFIVAFILTEYRHDAREHGHLLSSLFGATASTVADQVLQALLVCPTSCERHPDECNQDEGQGRCHISSAGRSA